jgi:hypothetical protein
LSCILGVPHVELDSLHWAPGWVPKPSTEFARLVDIATADARWVVDGNYSLVRSIVWPRATAIVWLNLGFATVLGRALRRTVRRSLTGETLFSGNRESLGRAFLSRDSILLWVVRTHGRRRREFATLRRTTGELRWFELRRAAQVSLFLESLARDG